ncbi:hypothetical protein [Leifsonia sp. Root112D2]|jgi:peptidoglycan/LPS O-acetylase OafA/YrhL|uniref:hypothetical protein n=1 Tax=Leifsonia sp. Root112D2 TaxID=1736426 RepID=UPI0006FF4A22|nr:hypothetical protein [Leifsonia sp. Root112D2]KQV07300.1 hypothetical protein ASC63_08325 [Leifsonia sp. Root112D2]
MTTPTPVPLSPARRWASIVAVWLAAAVCSVIIIAFAQPAHYTPWLSLTLAICVVGALCVQLATQEKRGFVSRLVASIMGAIAVLAIASVILAFTGLGA